MSTDEPSAKQPPRTDEPSAKQPPKDVIFVHSPADKGEGFKVLRAREGSVQLGEVRPVKEGEPLQGDLLKLTPRQEHQRLFDVEVLMENETARGAPALGRPAQVATDDYRRNWDAVFGGKPKGELPN